MRRFNQISFIFILSTLFLTGMIDPTMPPHYIEKTDNTALSRVTRLSGVFIRQNSRFAVIDNQIVKSGDWLADGSLVSSIHQEAAIILKSNHEYETLHLPTSIRLNGVAQ